LPSLASHGMAPVADVSSEQRGVAAFDFDGTLVAGDSLPRYLSLLLGRDRFAAVLGRAAPAMFSAYRSGGRDGSKAALLARAVAGVPATRAAEVGEHFASRLVGDLRPKMAERLVWHRSQGHRTVLVSASLALYLEEFGKLTGFDDVIATRLEVGPAELLTGKILGENVRAAEKALLLARLLGPRPATVWAYGDSRGDREMLAMADHPILLRRVGRRRQLSVLGRT
ncbi:MAG TPA: HAD-IB family hydrolase, partial [Acidimicrobiales bacterium]|nr:HAD-IB family hydrolase [Acidimicrobiales bacterium]